MDETIVFFRDDDVRFLDPLRTVMNLFLEESIPCSYQVIPSQLDAETARTLRDLKQAHPDLVFLNQHGLHHEQELGGRRRWSEFAGRRPYEMQLGDIRDGRQKLQDALGEAFDADVFTPPCHKYDGRTLQALAESGFAILSAGVHVDGISQLYYRVGRQLGRISLLGGPASYHGLRTPGTGLAEVSVCIDVDEDTDRRGHTIEKTVDGLWREFEAARSVLANVGVMLHHERYGSDRRLETMRSFLRRLKQDPRVRFETLPGVAAACGAA